MATQQQIVYKWLEELRVDLIKEYDRLGLRSSGNYAKQLESFATATRGILYGAKYTYQMQNGRKAGTWPPRAAIEKWIDDKKIKFEGITKSSLAFLIQRKIFREGIKVPNKFNEGGVISNILTVERIDALVKQLDYVNLAQVSSEIIELIKEP